MTFPCIYRARAGFLVTLIKEWEGYFEIQNTRIRIYYTKELEEVNGEKGLDCMRAVLLEEEGPFISNAGSYEILTKEKL